MTTRTIPPQIDQRAQGNRRTLAVLALLVVTMVGLAYASVPLYRMFCQATGFGGTVKTHKGGGEEDGYDLPADPASLPNNRLLTISFNTDVDSSLPWSFKPVQKSVSVYAGQTSLAFFEVLWLALHRRAWFGSSGTETNSKRDASSGIVDRDRA